MAMGFHGASAYLDQWLYAATKGKVVAEYAVMVADRVRFCCMECGLTLTANVPNPQTIDYGVQEFVRLHAHNGEYEKTHVTPGGTEGKPVQLTADFKPVGIWKGADGVPDGPTNVGGKTDLKPTSAAKILEQVNKFSSEFADKLLDESIAKKIEQLQSGDVGTVVPKTKGPLAQGPVAMSPGKTMMFPPEAEWGDIVPLPPATDAEVQLLEKELAKKRALENSLKVKLLTKQLEELTAKQANYVPVEPVKKEKPLVIPTGRKFK